MKNILPLLLIFLLTACGSQNNLADIEAKRPSWAKAKPIVSGHYVGIGQARKTTSMQHYQQNARNNALKEIAEEISVNISSTSVLRKLEMESAYSEDYTSNIVTSSDELLEGYELIDTYEDEMYYFVYYQLDKAKYQQLKQERLDRAKNKAMNNLQQSKQHLKNNDALQSLGAIIKALEDIRSHFHEDLEATVDNQTVYLDNYLVNEFQTILNNIQMRPEKRSIRVTRGQSSEPVEFKIFYNTIPLKQFPVKGHFDLQTLHFDQKTSNYNGLVQFNLEKINSAKNQGTVSVKTDIEKILTMHTQDLLIRNLIRKLSVQQFSVAINITQPAFYITIPKGNNGQNFSQLKTAFADKIREKNFRIVENKSAADYIIDLDGDFSDVSVVNNRTIAWLQLNVEISDQQRKTLFQSNDQKYKGLDLNDKQSAISDAFKNASAAIKKWIFDEFYYDEF